MQQIALRAEYPNLSDIDLYPLRKRADVFATIAAALDSHPLARGVGELRQHVGCDRLLTRSAERCRHALGIRLRLIARGLERCNAILEVGIVHVGNAILDCVKKPLESQVSFGSALVEVGHMGALARRLFLPSIQHRRQDGFQSVGLEQPVFQMLRHQIVQLLHRHRHAGAGGWPLPGFGRTGVIAILPTLTRADRHGTTALRAMD